MNRPTVISGEASETDSEEDVVLDKATFMTTCVQGAEVAGEDSESETENDGSISSAISALDQSNRDIEAEDSSNCNSLLHHKLRETNKKLYSDIENYYQSLVDNASRTLNNVDQKLLQSQLSLQGAVTSLRSLNYNSSLLKDKLQSLLSANFIPNIKSDE